MNYFDNLDKDEDDVIYRKKLTKIMNKFPNDSCTMTK